MRDQINIIVAVSCSMMITFGFHCALNKATLTNTLFQRMVLHFTHHVHLFYRCLLYEWRGQELCEQIVTTTNEELLYMYLFSMIICLICILTWFYGSQVLHCTRAIICTLCAVDFLARYADTIELWYQVDILTVYFFIWQFMFIVWKWQMRQLFSPFVIIEQASFCIFLAFFSYFFYDMFHRYIPFKINLLWFWFISIGDIYLCLHPNGWLRNLFANYKFLKAKLVDLHNPCKMDNNISNQSTVSLYIYRFYITYVGTESEGDSVPCCYYTKGAADCGGQLLGVGDFYVYNILLLVLLPLFPSIETKVWVTLGCIISIIIGQLGTVYLRELWETNPMPGIPFPIVCFSTYVLLLHVVMTFSDECAYL